MNSPVHACAAGSARASRAVLALLITALVTASLVVTAPAAEAKRFTPREGVTVNYPLGTQKEKRAVISQILRSVDSAPKGSTIRFASWNIRGSAVVDTLIGAHQRGVGVRVVMDRKNAYRANVNREVNRLQKALEKGNGKRPAELKSGLRKCRASCRGKSGFGHSKFFVFSRSGKARQVVINSSSNATDLAATNQWNDAFTMVGDPVMYDAFAAVFDQMYADRPVQQSFVTATSGSKYVEFYPFHGDGTEQDPILRELDQVTCKGATNEKKGRTRIEIAMTSWFGDRGLDIAEKIRALKNDGCAVKIVYAVAGNEVLRMLRRAGIRLRHIVQDFNRDGVYDRYLHTKVLTIRGVYGTDTGAFVTINGSANWSPLSLLSDEAVMRIMSRKVLRTYNTYIGRLFRNPPPNRGGRTRGGVAERVAVAVPGGLRDDVRPGQGAYALVQPD